MTNTTIPKAEYVFEVSFEVCNKVGGIHTVLSSKAHQMMEHYKNYVLIGPYFETSAKIEFASEKIPDELLSVFSELETEGIVCHYGKWIEAKGNPNVILLEFSRLLDKKNSLKEMYWNDFKIDSIRGYWDFEEPALWSYACGRLIHSISKKYLPQKNIVAHFHEWLSGFGLLYLKKNCPNIATIFTTHATVLGRCLAANNVDLYHSLDKIDPTMESYRFNVESKHLTEKMSAINATIFTTVSEITALEAEKFLGRKPEVLVYNGLDIEKFPSFEDISILHRTSRDKIREFLTYYFFPYYTFDVNNSLIFCTAGRFEFHNKGYDLMIESLGKLNELLKRYSVEKSKTVSVIFWIPMSHQGLKMEVLENKNYYMRMKSFISNNGSDILTRLIYDVLAKKENPEKGLLNESFLYQLKKDLIAFERKGNPPYSTHNIDENTNPLVVAFKQNGLLNRKEDFVKVIIQPVYIDGNDGFIDLSYYDALTGCHMGLFPSYYEPWGYTPLETMAIGVPSLTTDLSGFGKFLITHNALTDGVYVLNRLNKDTPLIVDEFASKMFSFLQYSHQKRVECKLNAKKTSEIADWKFFIENYILAHNLALDLIKK